MCDAEQLAGLRVVLRLMAIATGGRRFATR
jgi:hypothetical protein